MKLIQVVMVNVMKIISKKESSRIRVRRHRKIASKMSDQENVVQRNLRHKHQSRDSGTVDPNSGTVNNERDQPSLEIKLRLWAIKNNITRNALCDLLKILISVGLNWLPLDARTLLQTPQNITLNDVGGGKLWYHGIQSNLRNIYKDLNRDLELILNFNSDGIPLHKSSRKEFWPILANLHSKNTF